MCAHHQRPNHPYPCIYSGGKLYEVVKKCRAGRGTDADLRRLQKQYKAPLTSDHMESLFGYLDYVLSRNSKNLKLTTACYMTAWRYNCTGDWLSSLDPDLRWLIISNARKMYDTVLVDENRNSQLVQDELDVIEEEAVEKKFRSRLRLIKMALRSEDTTIFTKVFNSHCHHLTLLTHHRD